MEREHVAPYLYTRNTMIKIFIICYCKASLINFAMEKNYRIYKTVSTKVIGGRTSSRLPVEDSSHR